MKKYNVINQMVICGLLTGLAIVVGAFAHFTVIGQVYLIGIVVFLMPLFLRIDFLIIATITSVTVSDVLSGYGHLAWISAIVYTVAVVILWLFSKMKLQSMYWVGLLLAALIIIAGYFIIEWPVFGMSFALKDLVATPIEMAITLPVVSLLYFPMKIIAKTINKH